MAKKRPQFKFRPPRLRLTAKGLKLVNLGAVIGGRTARVNVTPSGVSASVGVPGASYNTRQGCLLSPFTLIRRLLNRKKG